MHLRFCFNHVYFKFNRISEAYNVNRNTKFLLEVNKIDLKTTPSLYKKKQSI